MSAAQPSSSACSDTFLRGLNSHCSDALHVSVSVVCVLTQDLEDAWAAWDLRRGGLTPAPKTKVRATQVSACA